MKMVTLASTIVTLANVAHAGMTEPELAFRDAARTIAKTAKVDLASHTRALDTGLRDLLHATAASGDVAAAVDAAYDLVLDRYAAAHGDALRAATELRAAGVGILATAGVSANALPRAFQDGGNGTWDAHGRALVKGLGATFARMEKLQHAFGENLAEIAQQFDDRLVLNVTHAAPDLPAIVGPVAGFASLPTDPGTKLRILAFWTVQGSAMGPAGMGGGVAEPNVGAVRARLRGPGGVEVEQLVGVESSGRFEFWFGLPIAPGVYTVEVDYETERPGGDALAVFVAGS